MGFWLPLSGPPRSLLVEVSVSREAWASHFWSFRRAVIGSFSALRRPANGCERRAKRLRTGKDFQNRESVSGGGHKRDFRFHFSLSEDDHRTMRETLDRALEMNTGFANFYCAMAYPGSNLYNAAVREGWPLPETWSGCSQHSVDKLPLPTKHLLASEVIRLRDHAFQTYFNNPNYIDMVLKNSVRIPWNTSARWSRANTSTISPEPRTSADSLS